MENRRQTYRHPFVEAETIRVELLVGDNPTPRRAELIDLSIEGMKVRFHNYPAFAADEQMTTRLIARPNPPVRLRMSLLGRVKYVLQTGPSTYLGIQFLQAAAPMNDRRESTLGRFLAEEQRRLLRQRLPAQDA